jgi:hypothetical protein
MRRRTLAATVVLAAALAAAGATLAATRDPHAEQLRLNATDVALAKHALVRLKDLAPGWKGGVYRASDSDSPCARFDPDLSAFTITGRADSKFSRDGADILSHVEVYASRRQAREDFRLGAKPPLARCFADAMVSAIRADVGKGITVKLLSSRAAYPGGLGERAFAAHVVALAKGRGTLKLYLDLLAFQRGRSIGVIMFMGAGGAVRGQLPLARLMTARMR